MDFFRCWILGLFRDLACARMWIRILMFCHQVKKNKKKGDKKENFAAEDHFYPYVLNCELHPTFCLFLDVAIGTKRIVACYCRFKSIADLFVVK